MTSSTTADAGQGLPGRRSARPGPSRRRLVRVVLLVAVLVVVAALADLTVLARRVDHIDVDLSGGAGDADGRTWVLVGLDSREDLPEGADVADFGTPTDVPGARADVVLVVHQTDAGSSVLSVPRDVVVRTGGRPGRLALTWERGPQATVAALCSLGIPTDHLVTVDLRGFADVVDAAGGLDVDVPLPVRDPGAGLELTRQGRQHVDGATALALVRSRHPEHLVDGRWEPAQVDPDGRATAAATALSALVEELQGAWLRPWRLQGVAWAGSAAVAVDPDTSFPELAALARSDLGPVQVLPVGPPANDTIIRFTTPETTAATAAMGLSCTR
ncbi:LCP family protein [Modestobacter sp. SSW1-42]|uniref:LCP family protein n=1 Tax=Modestobacter sp. SSW1-42 TaxID=596372 RepID=UPI0039868438